MNGEIVTTPGVKADPAGDRIRVDGKVLESAAKRRYFAVNKPKACVATTSDPEGRRTVMDLLDKRARKGLYPSDGSTTTPKACCCSPTTAILPTVSSPPRTALRKPTR